MQYNTLIIAATAALFAGQAMGSAMIATNPLSACNCPNNCKHKAGSSCRYYAGPSDKSAVLKGTCTWVGNEQTGEELICVAK